MANPACQPATDVTTQTATLNGTADNVPLTGSIRIDYSFTPGGPYGTLGTPTPGTNTPGQAVTESVIGLAPNTPYYYVVNELDAGNNIIATSGECSFVTLGYNITCEVLSAEGENPAIVRICADFVSDGLGGKAPQQLQLVSAGTAMGPFNTLEGQVPGTFTDNQCEVFVVPLDVCEIKFFHGRVTPVPTEYEVDWAYSHMGRSNAQTETVQLRLGDQAEYVANGNEAGGFNAMTVVDTHQVPPGQAHQWFDRSGTFPVPSGTTQLHMGFVSIVPPPPSSVGNFIDSASIVLRRVVPSPLNLGEQIINGSFEFPAVPVNGLAFPPEEPTTPGIAWRTTDPVNVLELWAGPNNNTDGTNLAADTGNQWAELNAFNPAELYQIVDLDVTFAESEADCVAFAFDAITDCSFAQEGVDEHTITVCGDICGPPTYYYVFQYGECGLGFANQTPFTPLGVSGIHEVCSTITVPCSACVQYRLVLFNTQFDPVVYGQTCTVQTHDCPPSWCGGEFDIDNCIPVDIDGDGDDDYFNCNQV